MSDDGDWHRVDASRADASREWEVFLRETETESLRHVGSVSAPSDDLAREQAAALFDHAAETLWLCPTDETRRFTRSRLGAAHADGAETDTESESDDTTAGFGDGETPADADAAERAVQSGNAEGESATPTGGDGA
ncbi:Htur_1727 family rSAM-partnered candidate RiPP [Halobaculum sp. MBLA0147]|uniref:Htur_1727 family rSAM-partnered candidate RiPP n=1 Tax=Halobaculum sp. MBLA0147 TaxID=3079934 RepID=UPI003525108E